MLHFCFLLFASSQKTITNEEIALITYVIFFTLVLVGTFIVFFITFQKRKNQLLFKQIKQKQEFEEELIKTQQEIQEETFKHVGRELHDNVGQLLVYSTMQMNSALKSVDGITKSKVTKASESLKQSLEEVRALSKSLNSDVIFNLGFNKSLHNEIQRLNKSGLITAKLNTAGDLVEFENNKDEVILFRILQEFFSNTLKYSEAEVLTVDLSYDNESLVIKVTDNGVGFDKSLVEEGSGMTNMKKRAEMLQAEFNLKSEIGKGTELKILYSFRSS
ncbi:MAG: hypothetical protein Wins2KO_00880 [Winogradskyella sp.]